MLNQYDFKASQDNISHASTSFVLDFQLKDVNGDEKHQDSQIMHITNSSLASLNTTISLPELDLLHLESDNAFERATILLSEAQELAKTYNYEEAISILEKNSPLFDSFSKVKGEQALIIFYNQGFTYYKMYLYEDAMKSFNLAEEFSFNVDVNSENAMYFRAIHNMMADVHMQYGDFAKSFRYLNNAVTIIDVYFRESLDKKVPTFTTKAELLYTWNLDEEEPTKYLEEAESCLQKVLVERKKNGDNRMIGFTYLQMTQLYIRWASKDESKRVQANECFEKGLEYSRKNLLAEKYFMIGRHWRNKGQISILEGKKDQAKYHYETGILTVDETLPRGNFFSRQFRKEYREYFGEDYQLKFLTGMED